MIMNPESLVITEESQLAFIEMLNQYIRDVLGLKNPNSSLTKNGDFTDQNGKNRTMKDQS